LFETGAAAASIGATAGVIEGAQAPTSPLTLATFMFHVVVISNIYCFNV